MKVYVTSTSRFEHTGLRLPTVRILDRTLWGPDSTKGGPEVPEAEHVRAALAAWAGPTTIDIEHWNVDQRHVELERMTEEELQANIDRMVDTMNLIRKVSTAGTFGFYSLPTLREYWPAVRNIATLLDRWQRRCERLMPLAQTTHVNYPSLYTFYDFDIRKSHTDDWKRYAEANVELTRRLFPKPVMPYLWPRYHDNGDKPYQPIGYDAWLMQLQHLKSLGVDGVVIWDAESFFGRKGYPTWDGTTGWVNATKFFLNQQGGGESQRTIVPPQPLQQGQRRRPPQ